MRLLDRHAANEGTKRYGRPRQYPYHTLYTTQQSVRHDLLPKTVGVDVEVSKVRNVNVVVKQFTVEYFQEGNSKPVGSDEFDSGKKEGLQDDLIQCSGTTQTVLQGLGPVTAIFDFQAFVTPRGKA